MEYAFLDAFYDKINIMGGIAISLLSYVFGAHWVLFVGFLLLNVGDYLTGCLKSKINKKTSSVKGLNGVIKKLGYWVMIMVAFGMSAIFIEIGVIMGINLRITEFIGWFVLASLIINECRSIIENFVEAGYSVPKVLISGLEIANKALEESIPDELEPKDDTSESEE